MDALNVDVLWFLAHVKVLDPTVGEFQGVPQVRWAALPGLMQLSRWNPQRFGKETVELFGECHHSAVTFSAHAFDDGFDSGCGFFLRLSGGAC